MMTSAVDIAIYGQLCRDPSTLKNAVYKSLKSLGFASSSSLASLMADTGTTSNTIVSLILHEHHVTRGLTGRISLLMQRFLSLEEDQVALSLPPF